MQSNEIVYIHHLTIKSLLVKTMPCWAAHTLYQLMTFKVMHTPLLPPLGFHYTCQVMHKVLICYNFFCFLHFQISGIDHSNVMFHLGSGGGLLVTCFFYPLGTVNYVHPASRGFFPAWLLAFVKSFRGGDSWKYLVGVCRPVLSILTRYLRPKNVISTPI